MACAWGTIALALTVPVSADCDSLLTPLRSAFRSGSNAGVAAGPQRAPQRSLLSDIHLSMPYFRRTG